MGWSYGINPDRPEGDQGIGYSVVAKCDKPDCAAEIDRGVSYACGGEHFGGEYGCGGYFCPDHLKYEFDDKDNMSPQLCFECAKLWLEKMNKKDDKDKW